MFHHLSFGVTDVDRTAAFYDATLAPLGLVRVWEDARPTSRAVGYGVPDGGDQFAIKQSLSTHAAPGLGFHLAFAAPSEAAVRAFHRAALASGGTDNGQPGPRPHYGPRYYAAYVIDPDGFHLEAVINPE